MQESTQTQNGDGDSVRILGPLPETSGGDAAEHSPRLVIDQKVVKVTVGVCLKGHTPPESYHDRMLMYRYMGAREVEQFYRKEPVLYTFNYCTVGEIFVPFAREQICQSALTWDSDFVFMIDDDMLAPQEIFYQLARHNVDLVAALAFTRNPPHNPVIYRTIEGWDPVAMASYGRNTWVYNYPKDQFVECDAVGFGAVLFKTSILKKMKQPWFMGSHGAGEDITFCYAAKRHGFRVFMDTSVKLGHLSHPTIVTEEYVENFRKMTLDQKDFFYGKYQRYPTLEQNK